MNTAQLPAWTPGPWQAAEYDDEGHYVVQSSSGSACICYGAGFYKTHNLSEANANARLIAAAPEMARTIAMLTDSLEAWWECAGSPVHATEIEIMEARSLLARINNPTS